MELEMFERPPQFRLIIVESLRKTFFGTQIVPC